MRLPHPLLASVCLALFFLAAPSRNVCANEAADPVIALDNLAAADTAAATTPGGFAKTWVIGIDVGFGVLRHAPISFETVSVTGSDPFGGLGVEFGLRTSKSLLLGAEFAWVKPAFDDLVGASSDFTSVAANADWFPGESGLFLRGGIGYGWYSYNVDDHHESASDGGVMVGTAVGYEGLRGQPFRLGPEVTASWTDISQENLGQGVWVFALNLRMRFYGDAR